MSSISSSSYDCPNNISVLDAVVVTSGDFEFNNYVAVSINGTGGNTKFLATYTGSGGTPDTNRVLWGDNTNTENKIDTGFVSVVIDGTTYWLKTWVGGTGAGCSSNIVGTVDSASNYRLYGFVPMVHDAGTVYLRIYTQG